MGWTRDGLEYFAPGLWDFNEHPIMPLSDQIAESDVSMVTIGLKDLFQKAFDEQQRRLVPQFIRRTLSSARHFENTRNILGEYFIDHQKAKPKIEIYYQALDEAESCILHSHAANESVRFLAKSKELTLKFETQRKIIDELANGIKHFGEVGKQKPKEVVPTWFYTGGVAGVKGVKLSFSDFHSLLKFHLSICKLVASNAKP